MLATCICLNGSLLDQLSCTIVYLHNLFTCTFGRINMSVCLSANQVAHQLLLNGRVPNRQPKVRLDRQRYPDDPGFTRAFTAAELDIGILDDIQTELIKQFGPKARDWLLRFFNNCTETKKVPKNWRQAKVVALLKPGKDPSVAKSFRPISLLCHTYKLFERLILNRIAEHVDAKLIPEQAGFRPGKSCTSQLLNLTEHIEDGYEKRLITGAVFVDLSAAYDTVNHRRLLSKVLEMTGDVHLTDLIRTMLENRRFFVVLNGKKSRWRRQRNGLPQGSVLAPMLFNIYTNDQPVHADTRSFIYADDLCIASQGNDFNNIEVSLTSALSIMTTYYDTNQLRANPSKTQVCAFHLRNREAKRELNVMWNGTRLSNTTTPVYLGVHLDRTLCYKTHIEKTKMKVNARNNIIRKLADSKWGCKASTLRPSCLALCYSVAEYACPVWARSAHYSTRAQAEPGSTRLLPNHLGLPQTNELRQCILAGRYRSSTHRRRTVACRMERTPNNRRQTSTIPSPTNCKQIEVAEELHAHRHAARLVCKQQQAAALERQPDRRAILCQNGTGGGRVFAGWIWRGLVLLTSH